jgi:hypothetical protein
VVGRPASLPLFQYTLTELFDHSDGEALTLAGYRQLGGVSGVIGATADRLFEGLSQPERTVLRAVLLRLVTVEESGQRARRRVEASELLSLDLDVVEVDRVLATFGRHRLLSFDRSAATGAPTVQLAHEALLTEWGRPRLGSSSPRSTLSSPRSADSHFGHELARTFARFRDQSGCAVPARHARMVSW